MDGAQDFIYITWRCIYLKPFNDPVFKLMTFIERSILLKSHVSCNFMPKYYIIVSLRQFTKTVNEFFDLFTANENFEICIPVWYVQLNKSKQFLGNFYWLMF